jgi:hypothetical protein
MNCPNCTQKMTTMTLEGHLVPSITLQVCAPCQFFWFEMFKALQLATSSTLQLMKFIGENSSQPRPQLSATLRCPVCSDRLKITHDWQRNTRFNYWRCDQEHGQFISFLDFLREKDFIHPISRQQIAELKKTMQVVNCSNCGAPIDLNKDSTCQSCGSPISMLDMAQPQHLIEQLQQTGAKPRWMQDPSVALDLAKVMLIGNSPSDYYHSGFGREWHEDASAHGLVEAGLKAVARWLMK